MNRPAMLETRAASEPQSLLGSITRSVLSQDSAEQRLELAKIWIALGRYRSLKLCRLPARVSSAGAVDAV